MWSSAYPRRIGPLRRSVAWSAALPAVHHVCRSGPEVTPGAVPMWAAGPTGVAGEISGSSDASGDVDLLASSLGWVS